MDTLELYRLVRVALANMHRASSPPLYRMTLAGTAISGVIQLVTGKIPEAVEDNSPVWFNTVFSWAQLVGAVVVLTALVLETASSRHARKLFRSLGVEFIGLIALNTVVIVYVVAVAFSLDSIPVSMASWGCIMWAVWLWIRMRDIWRTMRRLTA